MNSMDVHPTVEATSIKMAEGCMTATVQTTPIVFTINLQMTTLKTAAEPNLYTQAIVSRKSLRLGLR
jgi:hypothetical protein